MEWKFDTEISRSVRNNENTVQRLIERGFTSECM